MIRKIELKKKAIAMRKKGITYSAILEKVPVAKSTLALWFKDFKLSKPQFQRLTKNKLEAAKRGGIAKKKQRIERSNKIKNEAIKEIGEISDRELWLIGTTLYWAEGAKEKDWRPGSGTSFINMDSDMVRTYLKWLDFCQIEKNRLNFSLFVHENHKNRIPEIKKHWSRITNHPISSLSKLYWKKNKVNTKRKNIGNNYFGILKINVLQSTDFLRKINGWVTGIYKAVNKM